MTITFEGQIAIVTGGASGIGRAACLMLAKAGAKVIVADINEAGAEATVRAIGENASSYKLDVTDPASWDGVIASCLERHARLDILVNCAGIGCAGNFEELSLEQWRAMIDVNLTGVFLGCQRAVTAMREAKNGGSIINLSSIGGLVGGEDIAGYCATKGGVTLLSKSVALHGAKFGIRCNSVHPTYVDSEMLDSVAEQFPSRAEMLAGMAELVPIGRVAKPDDIASTILFLASDHAAMITGSAMVVDGGQLAGLPAKHSV